MVQKWENVCIANEFERLTGIPTWLIQDSRAAAWGEYMAGNGQGKHIVVCVTIGTGIGTGIVIGGKIFDGALGGAGELGHIPVFQNGRECGCEKKGALNTMLQEKVWKLRQRKLFILKARD